MQTLVPTLFPCYAPGDRELVSAAAAFLERGAGVRIFLEEGRMEAGQDLVMKAREARMADIVLVFFSRESLPSRWPRALWEDALVKEPEAEEVRIGFARCDDCNPPAVLLPRFNLAGLPIASLRELKRWVRRHGAQYTPPAAARPELRDADLEVLGIGVADRPGTETVPDLGMAFEFVRRFRHDFDEVFVLDCPGRTLTALAGDLGTQIGLRLEGDREENLSRLRDYCSARRVLILLAGADPAVAAELTFGGRASTVLSREAGIGTEPNPLRSLQQQLASAAQTASWQQFCELAREGRRLTTAQMRIAECFELMEQWHAAAEARSDRKVLDESAREMVWILEAWGREEEARRLESHRALHFDDQLPLPFDAL